MKWMVMLVLVLAQGARAQEAVAPGRIEAALERYRGEPSIERVLGAALRRAASPDRARDAMDRARFAGLLPAARAAVRRGQAIDLRGWPDGPRANVSTDDDLTLEASLVFRLDRLVFAPHEPTLLRELGALERARAELVRAVVALYFERRRLQLERDLLGSDDVARTVRILEIEALLDAFTDGAFSRMMGARAREPR